MGDWGLNTKVCATCNFWGGKRERYPSDFRLRALSLRNAEGTGMCAKKKCQTSHGATCKDYDKWAVL